jgi:putative IMPACT (imprinted ancient) family translation regulator
MANSQCMQDKVRRAILSEGQSSLTIERSRFLGFALPAGEPGVAEQALARIRALHPQASHHCFAYRLGQGLERQSDDGEPQGTGGLPLLETLRRRELDMGLLCVVRYYGGRKLGRPGLYRAYLGAGVAALDRASCGRLVPGSRYEATVPHMERLPLERAVAAAGGEVLEESFAEWVRIVFWLPRGTGIQDLLPRAEAAGRAVTLGEETRAVPDQEGGGPA